VAKDFFAVKGMTFANGRSSAMTFARSSSSGEHEMGLASALRRLSVVVAQQTTEALTTYHLAGWTPNPRFGLDQVIVETLMIALGVIMRQILPHNMTQRRFTHDDHPIQRFLFDRAHKPFAMRIQVWRSGR
jgi:hypothetical protein